MRILDPDRPGCLRGRAVFLSGSVPDPERGFVRVPDAAFVIEQAVLGLARAVLGEGGRIVFGAHPSISPLVASVAPEYRLPGANPGERPVVIYQSRAFEEGLPNETWDMYRLGFADLVWTDAKGGERYKKGDPASRKCPKSLTEMRTRMIRESRPVAMVVMGGMDGILEEVEHFNGRGPIYAARDTGGAVVDVLKSPEKYPGVRVLEDDWRAAGGDQQWPADDPRARPMPPYAAMMQWLVAELSRLIPSTPNGTMS